MITLESFIFISRWDFKLLSENLEHPNPSRPAEELLHPAAAVVFYTCSGVSQKNDPILKYPSFFKC